MIEICILFYPEFLKEIENDFSKGNINNYARTFAIDIVCVELAQAKKKKSHFLIPWRLKIYFIKIVPWIIYATAIFSNGYAIRFRGNETKLVWLEIT